MRRPLPPRVAGRVGWRVERSAGFIGGRVLAMENRSVLAYDIVPSGARPVTVSVATQDGWSLVGVMGSAQLDATGAVALVSSRGLGAAVRPMAAAAEGAPASQLSWQGPVRAPDERRAAKVLASTRLPMRPAERPATKPTRPTRRRKGAHQ